MERNEAIIINKKRRFPITIQLNVPKWETVET